LCFFSVAIWKPKFKNGVRLIYTTSGLIAEFFLQSPEETHLTHLSNKHKIAGYFRYVDDILIIYDSSHTDINSKQNDFNTIHPNMKFTTETESNKRTNFLVVTIHKAPINWKIFIYRKPSFTDTIIPYSSYHPGQRKYAAIKFLHNRLNTYHLHKEEYNEEVNTIRDIMTNNDFPVHTLNPPNPRHPTNSSKGQSGTVTQKWVSFTYSGKATLFITNLFKKASLRIAMRRKNNVQKLLMQKHETPEKYMHSGAYKLTFSDCNKAYIGQTGGSFAERYDEQKNAFKTNSHSSNYTKHILEQLHTFGTIHETMQILQYHGKVTHLSTVEIYYIYSEFSKNNHLNDEHFISPNKIFDALLKLSQP
jgi:hypothetical protein